MSHIVRSSVTIFACGALALAVTDALSARTPGATVVSQQRASGGDGKILVGTYAKNVLIVDEATFRVTDSIPLTIGIPYNFSLLPGGQRLWAMDPLQEKIELVEVATKKSLGVISLSKPGTRARISGVVFDPLNRYALLIVKNFIKQTDRYEIGRPTLVKYDLEKRAVVDTVRWPGGTEREFAQIIFSPKGDLLYFFTDDGIQIWNAQTFAQIDTWDMTATSLDEGLGRVNFSVTFDFYEEPGFYTGTFRMPDPVNNRQFIGLARIDLVNRKLVDYFTFGPNAPVQLRLAPGRKRAYGLQSAVGNYAVWSFDVESRRMISRIEFEGRPRMGLHVSTNGTQLYIGTAGMTIDRYDAQTIRHLGTLDLGADMTRMFVVPASVLATPR